MDSNFIKNSFFENIKQLFNYKRQNSDNYSLKTSVSKNMSVNIKAQNIIIEDSPKMALYDSKKIIKEVIEELTPQFKNIAKNTFDSRIKEYEEKIISELSNLNLESLLKFKKPETQYILSEATRISGLKEDKNLRNLLAKLVIEKVKNDDRNEDNFKDLIFNEAIKTIEVLNLNQIKIITLSFLLREVYYTGIKNIDQYKEYLDNTIKPFIDIDINRHDYEYIDYAGLAILTEFFADDYISSVVRRWPHLFLKPIDPKSDRIGFLNYHNPEMLIKNNNEEYFLNFPNLYTGKYDDNLVELKSFLVNLYSISEIISDNVIAIFKSHIKDKKSIEDDLINLSDTSRKIIELFKDTLFKSIRLTTVGRLIAFTNYVESSGDKLDFDVFLLP